MAVNIRRNRREGQVQEILTDPEGYFARARDDARDEVAQEMSARDRAGARRPLLRRLRGPAGPSPA